MAEDLRVGIPHERLRHFRFDWPSSKQPVVGSNPTGALFTAKVLGDFWEPFLLIDVQCAKKSSARMGLEARCDQVFAPIDCVGQRFGMAYSVQWCRAAEGSCGHADALLVG